MTYNIRLDHAGDGLNRWGLRKVQLATQIRFYDPAILGIQEGLPQQVSYLDSALANYNFIGVGREDGKAKGEFSAIYVDTTRIQILNGSTFWLSKTPEVPSVGWDAALPRVCTYGLFEDRQTTNRFWVFNTHFDHVGEQARLESMKLILKKISEFNTENLPVILLGDLNAEPNQPPVLEMKKILLDSRDVAELVFGPESTFNGFDFETIPTRRIDYVAVSRGIKVRKYAVLTDSKDRRFYSDHFAVYCEVELK